MPPGPSGDTTITGSTSSLLAFSMPHAWLVDGLVNCADHDSNAPISPLPNFWRISALSVTTNSGWISSLSYQSLRYISASRRRLRGASWESRA